MLISKRRLTRLLKKLIDAVGFQPVLYDSKFSNGKLYEDSEKQSAAWKEITEE
jgi:hypothetical protein